MTAGRLHFAGLRAAGLNLLFGALPLAAALIYGKDVLGSAYPWYVALAGLFALMALGSTRCLRLDEEGVTLRAFRLRAANPWLRVDMDWDEIDRVEVVGRHHSLFSPARVRLAALTADDGRMLFLAGRDFDFSPRCRQELAEGVEAARGRPLGLVEKELGERQARPSLASMLPALALAIAGFLVMFLTLEEGARRARTLAAGLSAKAHILALSGSKGEEPRVILKLGEQGPTRKVQVTSAWVHGRRKGDPVQVLVHPADREWFMLPAETWPGSRGYLVALLLVAFGARFFIRNATLPSS